MRQRAGQFKHAAATEQENSWRKESSSEGGGHIHFEFLMNSDTRCLTKQLEKVGLESQDKHCKPTIKVVALPNVEIEPDLAHRELSDKVRPNRRDGQQSFNA